MVSICNSGTGHTVIHTVIHKLANNVKHQLT